MKTLTEKLKGLEPMCKLWVYGPNVSNYPSPVLRTIGADELIVVDRASYDRLLAVAIKLADACEFYIQQHDSTCDILYDYLYDQSPPQCSCKLPEVAFYCLADCAKLLEGENG